MFFPVYLKHDDFFFHAEFEFKLTLSFWCDPGQCDDLYVVEIQYMLRGKRSRPQEELTYMNLFNLTK